MLLPKGYVGDMWPSVILCLAFSELQAGSAAVKSGEGEIVPPQVRVEQPWQEPNCCGPNCLYLLLRFHGIDADLEQLIAEMAPGDQGSSLAELKSHAASRNLDISVLKTSERFLPRLELPFIAHLETLQGGDHYVLVCRVDQASVHAMDGTTLTLVEISKANFFRRWTGYVVARPQRFAGFWPRFFRPFVMAFVTLLGCFLLGRKFLRSTSMLRPIMGVRRGPSGGDR